ncbi:MAG: Uma2 family endonuclease [Leptolyngbya sp. Prado105]|nr:Uma2 family endonuclease [Leptolyngbya sp. Prado105]
MSSPIMVKLAMTDEQFFEFCQENRDLRIERNQFGEISIMPPAGSGTGHREINIGGQLWVWAEKDGTGIAFSSSAGFKLSAGAERSPDASWIRLDRWNTLTSEQQEKFAPICPDFVVELRSPSDNLRPLQAKMEEYQVEPGFQLGFLLDRKHRRVHIYRPNQSPEILENLDSVSADPILPGFVLNLSKVW